MLGSFARLSSERPNPETAQRHLLEESAQLDPVRQRRRHKRPQSDVRVAKFDSRNVIRVNSHFFSDFFLSELAVAPETPKQLTKPQSLLLKGALKLGASPHLRATMSMA